MKTGWSLILALIVGLSALPVAAETPATVAQTEIDYLLNFVGSSGCEFYRNGSWYDSQRAEAHLRNKYAMLSSSKGVITAEDFIDKAATRSSFSGQAYEARCSGAAAIRSDVWLREALARHRIDPALELENAPCESQGAWGIQESDSNRDVSLPLRL